MNEPVLRTRLHRAETKIQILEQMVEDKTRELYLLLQETQKSEQFLHSVAAAMPVAVIVFNDVGKIVHTNRMVDNLFGSDPQALIGMSVARFFVAGELPSVISGALTLPEGSDSEPFRVEAICIGLDGEEIPTLISAVAVDLSMAAEGSVLTACMVVDLREQHKHEVEMRQAQKLEMLGRLTAGVAHEINTPTQYVSDSLEFIREAMSTLSELIVAYRVTVANNLTHDDAAVSRVANLDEELDTQYIIENAPAAVDRAIDGLNRISGICRSIKDFSHSSSHGKLADSVNRRIEETLQIARNEYKYVAQVRTELGDLPLLECHGDELGQVILNLVINAAHSIAEKNKSSGKQGEIVVTSRFVDDEIVVAVSDNGKGIPAHLRQRIFDSFFTTKQVGHGSGQGLALAVETVRNRHGGRIEVESIPGDGATFEIFLPMNPVQPEPVL